MFTGKASVWDSYFLCLLQSPGQSRGQEERNRTKVTQCLAEWFKLDQLSHGMKVRRGTRQRKRRGRESTCARREEIPGAPGVAMRQWEGRGLGCEKLLHSGSGPAAQYLGDSGKPLLIRQSQGYPVRCCEGCMSQYKSKAWHTVGFNKCFYLSLKTPSWGPRVVTVYS